MMDMFCYQCEQRADGACRKFGVCGKDPQVAALQDLLVHAAKGIAQYAHLARKHGAADAGIDRFVIEALYTTLTNVNFDAERIAAMIGQAAEVRDCARKLYEDAARAAGAQVQQPAGPARLQLAQGLDNLTAQAAGLGILRRLTDLGPDVTGLQELILYGLKGSAAYVDHAAALGGWDESILADFHEMLDYLAGEPTDADELLGRALKAGELNLRVMELLDRSHTSTYGHPEPTTVRVTPLAGKCIVVSGHDLRDLQALLEQTAGEGINVYTHGEMLPALAYPALKKHPHLAGNYGGAWQDQRKEFDEFPGAVLMTTNCIQKPKENYKARIFTSGVVGWPGVVHITDRDFTPVIQAALAAKGFAQDAPKQTITIGFGHNAVMGVAGQVIEAVKAGKIRRFFLIGGCDGAKSGRNYYTELAQQVPEDCVILTLACGKYRFNKLPFGDIGGIPRLLDVGQCNDAYSAVRIAAALAEAFGCGLNDLPLSMVLSWFEQKAVAILLTLLHLGVRDMRLGPTLPAFVSPAVLKILADKFNIMPITTPREDLAAILGA